MPLSVAQYSKLIAGMLEDGDADEIIPLAQVKHHVMLKVIAFCQEMHELGQSDIHIEQPLPSADIR